MQKMIKSKKELKRIDWEIVKRLVMSLYYNNKIKRTSLAMKCNMGYNKCILYIDWLDKMNLINKEKDENGFEVVQLNEKGREFHERQFKEY